MSTDEQEKQLEGLLGPSRRSVKISLTQMLDYIDQIRRPLPPGDINFLLQTDREMAEKFYTQYERSLLDEIKKQRRIKEQVELAIGQYDKDLKDLKDEDLIKAMETAKDLLTEDGKAADTEYQKLTKNFPTLLQNALDKLKDEWQRLYTIAVASKTLTKDENLIQTLKLVVESAAFSVGIEAERISIVPGDVFALNFFAYLENFAVLTVPIYSVQAPWEWSVFWHELAGYKVRQLEKDTALTTSGENLERLHDLFKTYDEDRMLSNREDFLKVIVRDNPFSEKYISKLFSKDKLDLSDLGSFEHQFERMLANLPMENKFQIYEQIKADGWCVDWFKELFEDAWSALAFGIHFLVYFENILSRHDAADGRHPTKDIRLGVTKELLKLTMKPKEADDLENMFVKSQPRLSPEEEIVTKVAAQQILKFMSLIIAANTYRFFKFNTMEEYGPLLGELASRDHTLRLVGGQIKKAITDWATKFLVRDASDSEIKASAEDFIKGFSKDPDLMEAMEKAKKEIVPSHEIMLGNRDYEQLLELSFFERDFGFECSVISSISFGKSIINAINKKDPKERKSFKTIPSTQKVTLDKSCKISGRGGDNDITYVGPDNKTYHAQIGSWNIAFTSAKAYQLP